MLVTSCIDDSKELEEVLSGNDKLWLFHQIDQEDRSFYGIGIYVNFNSATKQWEECKDVGKYEAKLVKYRVPDLIWPKKEYNIVEEDGSVFLKYKTFSVRFLRKTDQNDTIYFLLNEKEKIMFARISPTEITNNCF